MGSTNLVIIRGHAGADAKGFEGAKGHKVAKLSVATNRSWIDRESGERREETDWVPLTILNPKTAQWAIDNVKKGDAIYAEARIAENRFTRDGQVVYSTDVIVGTIERVTSSARGDE